MAEDPRSWQDEGAEDLSLAEREWNPLAELGAAIVLVSDAIQQNQGLFCTSCTCLLGFHLICDDGACEFCGCDEIHKYCISCGVARPLEKFPVGDMVCVYCTNISPIKITHQCRASHNGPGSFDAAVDEPYSWNRGAEARKVLRELSD